MKSSVSALYSDNHLLVANKPSGMPTQPDFEEVMKAWVKQKYSKPGAVFLHAAHRLDKPVSGLVLFARTGKALSRLNEMMRKGEIRRIYLADVEGELTEKEGRLEHYLRHGSHAAIVSSKDDPEAKRASLTYQVERVQNGRSLVRIELETGRYHQIRAQFAAIGHPIVGDERYGARKASAIHLHCARLSLIHPVSKEPLSWESPTPF